MSTDTGDKPIKFLFLDYSILLFAAWTVACNMTVVFEGALPRLLLTFGILALVLLYVLWRHGWSKDVSPNLPEDEQTALGQIEGRKLNNIQIVTFGMLIVFSCIAAYCFCNNNFVAGWLFCCGCFALAFVPGGSPPVVNTDTSQYTQIPKSIWILAGLALVMTLCAHRWDDDDSVYVNMAVQVADHPTKSIYKHDLFLGIPGVPMHGAVRRIHSLEALAGTVSLITRIPAIYVMHFIVSGFGAVITVLAYGQLFQVIMPKRIIWCVIGALLFLIANGHMHSSYGNYSFTRMYQGKAILATAMVPAIIAYSLRFSHSASPIKWILLAASQISSVGLSPTGLWVAPSAAGLGLIAGISGLNYSSMVRAVAGLGSTFYVFIAGLYLKSTIKIAPQLMEGSWEDIYSRFINYPFGQIPFSLFILLIATTTWFLCPNQLTRKISIVFPLGLFLFFLNPLFIRFIASHATSTTAHWRCVWAIPIPAMAGVLFALHFAPPSFRTLNRRHLVHWILIAAFVLTQRNILSRRDRTLLSFPRLKVDYSYPVAEELHKVANNGDAVIVPKPVAAWVATFHNHAYMVMDTTDRFYWRSFAMYIGEQEAFHRLALTIYNEGTYKAPSANFLENGIRKYDVKAVCIPQYRYGTRQPNPNASQIRRTLQNIGFKLHKTILAFEIWVKR